PTPVARGRSDRARPSWRRHHHRARAAETAAMARDPASWPVAAPVVIIERQETVGRPQHPAGGDDPHDPMTAMPADCAVALDDQAVARKQLERVIDVVMRDDAGGPRRQQVAGNDAQGRQIVPGAGGEPGVELVRAVPAYAGDRAGSP